MYDELIKNLRGMAKGFCPFDIGNKMCGYFVTQEAADAIEELQQITTHYEEESKGWWLAACDAKEERERLKEQLDNAEIENIKLKEEFGKYRKKHWWIPVTERLPEEYEYVLCKTDYGMEVGYHRDEWGQDEWTTGNFGDRTIDVSHWMPLPQPPKDGES